jgi:hypothetical protein
MDDQILDQFVERKFKTKTGYCYVTPDKVILTSEGVRGNLGKSITGNRISLLFVFYFLMSAWILYSAYQDYLKGNTFGAVIYGLIGMYILFGTVSILNYSTTPVIDRKDIRKVIFVKGIGLTRSRFVIDFDEGGRKKKRMILLPGIFTNKREVEKAVNIMKEEGLCN